MPISVFIQATNETKFSISIEPDSTVLDLKTKIISQKYEGLLPINIRLIFAGRILKDDDALSTAKVTDGVTVHLVKSAPQKEIPVPKEIPQQTQQPQQPQQSQQPQISGLPPFMMPEFSGAEASMMEQMAQNPEMMSQAMEMITSNPQLFQSILDMNPSYRSAPPALQQMMRNPEFMRMAMSMSLGAQSPLTAGAFGVPGLAQPVPSQESPEVRFQSQLAQLSEMGFYDADKNIRALLATGGNVNLAIERLLQQL